MKPEPNKSCGAHDDDEDFDDDDDGSSERFVMAISRRYFFATGSFVVWT
jgi:hypothetical protein